MINNKEIVNEYLGIYIPTIFYSDRILWANNSAYDFFGVNSIDNLLGKTINEFATEIQDDGQSANIKIEYFISLAKKNGKSKFRLQLNINNDIKYTEINIINTTNNLLMIFQDITQYINRENELTYRISRLEKTLTNGSDAVWQYYVDQECFYFYPSIHKMLGYATNRSMIKKDEIKQYLHPDDEYILSLLDNIKNISDEKIFELRLKKANDEYIWFRLKTNIDNISYNKSLVVTGTISDINPIKLNELILVEKTKELQKLNTILKRNEATLKKNACIFDNMLENMPIGIVLVSLDSDNYIKINKYAIDLIGNPIDNLKNGFEFTTSKYWRINKTDTVYPQKDLPYYSAINGQQTSIDNLLIDFPDGTKKNIFMAGAPIYDKDKNIWGVEVCLCDITTIESQREIIDAKNHDFLTLNDELKMANHELLEAYNRAEENESLKSSFLENISHEIRSPMNGIIGFANILKDEELDREEQNMYIDYICSCSKQLLSIITDIVEFSKIETGQVTAKFDRVNVYKIAFDTFQIMKLQLKQNINYEFYCDDLYKKLVLYSDETKLQQIFTNLIGNAIKYTEKGFIKVILGIENDKFVFSVSDSGIGIRKENLTLIFRRFVRINNESFNKKTSGTGLGLSVAKVFANLLGGDIYVESEYEKGSTFKLVLPLTLN
ncbi:MAG: PAS domain-containing sensor histidine kinase [Bacteroidales bacterium]|nr:PAS domain-containing sensor histidine kinase [Bacteroidales bacterium]